MKTKTIAAIFGLILWVTAASATTNGLKIANDQAGADLGAKVMAADAACGSSPCEIIVQPGAYTITTQIVLGQGGGPRTLILGDGTYDNTMTDRVPIVMKDNTEITAAHRWGAKVYETVNRANAAGSTTAIADYLSSIDNSQPGNVHVAVRGLTFLQKATDADGVSATVQFGNVDGVSVEDCRWEGTSGFGVVFGGHSDLGNHAKNLRVVGNTMVTAATQNIAAVNFIDILVQGNTMIAGGAGGRDKSTFIDLELNTGTDLGQSFIVTGNIIDARGGNVAGPGTGISVVGGTRGAVVDGVISNNTIIGGGLDQAQQPVLAGGIRVLLCDNVEIVNNVIDYIGQVGIGLDASNNCSIKNNRVTDAGPAGVTPQTITLTGAMWNTVSGNELGTERSSSYWAGIYEAPDVSYTQTCDYNKIYDNRLYYSPSQTIANPDHELRITLSGPNSREWNNEINGETFGVAGVTNGAALTAGFIPGARASGVPALAQMLSLNVFGDSQPRLATYDPTNSDAANGYTRYKPANATTGRWQVAPLFPQMTTTARTTLSSSLTSADEGRLIVWDTDLHKAFAWDGTSWDGLW